MKEVLAYSYVRFSSPEQAKGDSFRRQTKAAREYCNKHGLVLADLTLHDLGLSAYHGNHFKHGALGQFVNAIEQGKIRRGSYLIVESFDRLSREEVDIAFTRFASLLRAGINIVTLQDSKVFTRESLNNTTDILISILEMLSSHNDSEKKAKRIREDRDEKHRKARENKTPTGYRTPSWIRLSDQSYSLIPERAAIIRRIFHLNNNGLGAIAISRLLNEEHIPAWGRSKTGWQTSYIKKILKTRTVLGEYQPHIVVNKKRIPEGEPITGFYPAVIDPNTFKLAQLKIASRDKRSGCIRKNHVSNLFTGLVKCKFCGNSMRYSNKGKPPKGGLYLYCSLAKSRAINKDGVSCKNRSIQYRKVEEAMLTVAATLNLKLTPSIYKEELILLKDKLAQVGSELDSIDSSIKRITNAIAELPDSLGLLSKLAELEAQQLDKKRNYKEIEKQIDSMELPYESSSVWVELKNTLKKLRVEAVDRSNVELRAKLNSQLVSCIDRIEFDNHDKVVSIHIDNERSVVIKFSENMKEYVVKPSWDVREFLPATYVVKAMQQKRQVSDL